MLTHRHLVATVVCGCGFAIGQGKSMVASTDAGLEIARAHSAADLAIVVAGDKCQFNHYGVFWWTPKSTQP